MVRNFPTFLPFFFVLQGCLINERGMGLDIFTSKNGCEKKDTNRHLDTDDIKKTPTGTATSFIGKPIEFDGKTVFTPRFLVDFPIIPFCLS